MISRSMILTAILLATSQLFAAVTPSSLFHDHMVLQREMTVPVWGTAEPKEAITVSFGGQTKSTTTDQSGKWMVRLDKLKASSKGRDLKISGSNTITLKDVLVGEVWICSGQSNMQMGLVPEVKALVPKAGNVRHFHVAKNVAFTAQDSVSGTWKKGPPPSAVAAGFSILLEKSEKIPVGIILSCWGSSSLEAWMPIDMAEKLPIFKQQIKEQQENQETMTRIKNIINSKKARSTPDDIFIRRQPNILYNAMISPLIPYACRGVVWYQGERNAANYDKIPKTPWYRRTIPITGYGKALSLWIQRYRKAWKKDDLHFIIVTLPGYAKGIEKVAENPTVKSSWAWMREAQFEALTLPHTSAVTTIDLGHPTNIHPKDKLPIGERLALIAQRDTLSKDIIAEGPVLKKSVLKGNTLTLHFDHAQGLKTTDGEKPKAFWISTNAKQWVQADAVIQGETILLTSHTLRSPKFVRYAFSAMPKTNLVNAANLPTRPFRTDK